MFLRILLLLTILLAGYFLKERYDTMTEENNKIQKIQENENNYKEIENILLNKLKSEQEKNDKLYENKMFSNSKELNKNLKNSNERIFRINLELDKYKIENELSKYEALNSYKNKIFNKDFLVEENWVWYWYIFKNSSFFDSPDFINKENLIHNWLNPENTLVTFNNWKIIFVKDYEKFRLISDKILYWVPEKLNILKDLSNIKIFDKSNDNLDKDYIILKNISENLTKKLSTKEEIIKELYAYILKNLKYQEDIKDDDFNIYSWIKTFKDKIWVCQWYVELFRLMLSFNNIKSELIKWDVVNSSDFPKIWHAWTKIDWYYYDPTFDDPIWAKKTKKFEDYYYYKLPKDLFYVNRFDYWTTPENLKNLSLNQRQNYVDREIFNISDKYKDANFNILRVISFKKDLWLWAKDEITIERIIKKYWYFKIDENLNIIDNYWQKRSLEKITWFSVNNENINQFLYQIKYDLKDYKIFIKDWKYYISNNYTFR